MASRPAGQPLEAMSMSVAVDKQRTAEREPDRWRRLELVFADYARVARMRREGLPLVTIAARLGWTSRTLFSWEQAVREWELAVKAFDRKGIKMSESSKL